MPWDTWSAGRVWIGNDGTRTYYVRIGGRYVSTREHTEDGALAWMIREKVGGAVAAPPLNDQWIAEYVEHCRTKGQDRQSVLAKERQLAEWRERIGVRKTTLPVLAEISKKMSGARNKVAALKAYFTRLRQQGRVQRQHDPTLDLAKPSAPSSDWDRLVPLESHAKVVAELDPRWGDLLVVLLGTGWHVSELLRFVRGGSIDGDVLVWPRHKSGEPHRTRESEKVRKAAAAASCGAGSASRSSTRRSRWHATGPRSSGSGLGGTGTPSPRMPCGKVPHLRRSPTSSATRARTWSRRSTPRSRCRRRCRRSRSHLWCQSCGVVLSRSIRYREIYGDNNSCLSPSSPKSSRPSKSR
jgi:hypothetical protein